MTIVAQVTAMGDGSMVTGEYRFGEPQTYGPLQAPEGVNLSEWALGPFVGMTQRQTAQALLYAGMDGDAHAAVVRQQRAALWGGIGGRTSGSPGGRRGHPRALSTEQVSQLRDRYARGGVTQRELALQFGVARQTVNRIINGHGIYGSEAA